MHRAADVRYAPAPDCGGLPLLPHRIRQQFFLDSGELEGSEAGDVTDINHQSAYETAKSESCSRVALQPAITEDELNQRLQLELSKNMWKRCNPGFNHMAVSTLSTTQEQFLYDEDNVRLMFPVRRASIPMTRTPQMDACNRVRCAVNDA